MTNIGATLKSVRLSRGIAQKDLIEKVGLTHTNLINIEKGRVVPRLTTLEKLCRELGVAVWQVIKRAETAEK